VKAPDPPGTHPRTNVRVISAKACRVRIARPEIDNHPPRPPDRPGPELVTNRRLLRHERRSPRRRGAPPLRKRRPAITPFNLSQAQGLSAHHQPHRWRLPGAAATPPRRASLPPRECLRPTDSAKLRGALHTTARAEKLTVNRHRDARRRASGCELHGNRQARQLVHAKRVASPQRSLEQRPPNVFMQECDDLIEAEVRERVHEKVRGPPRHAPPLPRSSRSRGGSALSA